MLSAALLLGAVVVLLGLFTWALWSAHSLGAASRDGELLVRTAERDSARAETKALREASGDGKAAAQGQVDAAARIGGAPDRLLFVDPDSSPPGSDPAGEAAAPA